MSVSLHSRARPFPFRLASLARRYAALASRWPSLTPADCAIPGFDLATTDAELRELFSKPPTSLAAFAYDAAAVVALAALRSAHGARPTPADVRATNFSGATGNLSFLPSSSDPNPEGISLVVGLWLQSESMRSQAGVALLESHTIHQIDLDTFAIDSRPSGDAGRELLWPGATTARPVDQITAANERAEAEAEANEREARRAREALTIGVSVGAVSGSLLLLGLWWRRLVLMRRKMARLVFVGRDGHPPILSLQPTCKYHLFLSHIWATGQDQAALIKRTLLLKLPGVSVFLECAEGREGGCARARTPHAPMAVAGALRRRTQAVCLALLVAPAHRPPLRPPAEGSPMPSHLPPVPVAGVTSTGAGTGRWSSNRSGVAPPMSARAASTIWTTSGGSRRSSWRARLC